MLVGQKLGPFLIDRELGSGAMGAVYRGRYEKTGQLVAVKVMAPGLGTTNSNAAARFEREAAILKQFNHPNIVRLFGIGKSHGTRYYAMEYIEGESLDRVMSRRSRMTWEEVITLGQQLCAALQHAHQAGVIHRDLKPSNLMILKDGTLKLTDFGIAKDMDVTRLTSANCTVGTAAYMSPEQCRGDPDLTHKSDLYSLGVVFYELVTGRKPFEAENAMDMFMQHVQGEFVRPSKRVLDMPVWLDTLVCQMLEKKPEHRPLDAGTIYVALGKIQEKVEAQLSAGVDAAKMRVIDRPRGEAPPDETDREMARTLLVGKGRKKRRIKKQKFYEKGWFVIAALVALIGAVGLTLFLALRPPPPEKLYEEAKGLMASTARDDHDKALAGPITQYLSRYGSRTDEQAEQVKAWRNDVQVEQCEDLVAAYLSKKESRFKFEAQDEAQKAAFKAVDDEWDGKVPNARRKWQEIRKLLGNDPWGLTAERHLGLLKQVDEQDSQWEALVKSSVENGREPDLPPFGQKAFLAYRAEHLGDRYDQPDDADLPLAFTIYERITEDKDASGKADYGWRLLAAKKARELKKYSNTSTADADRQKLVDRALGVARQRPRSILARSVCIDLVALYGDDAALHSRVEEAKKIIKVANDFKAGE